MEKPTNIDCAVIGNYPVECKAVLFGHGNCPCLSEYGHMMNKARKAEGKITIKKTTQENVEFLQFNFEDENQSADFMFAIPIDKIKAFL